MREVVIDTNPLVYIYHGVSYFGEKYAELLGKLCNANTFLIPKIVYGELSIIFENAAELHGFLSDAGIVVGEAKPETYVLASERWNEYNKRRILMCPKCAEKLGIMTCKQCGAQIGIRQHMLSDFLIGAYAVHSKGSTLITNDGGYFSSYFPELNIMTVEQ